MFDRIKAALERIKINLAERIEWEDAKCWAREYHPGWLQIAAKSKSEEARIIYRDKILSAYRGDYDG